MIFLYVFNVLLVVCGQLVLKVNKSKEDKAEEASRIQLLKFLNSSYDWCDVASDDRLSVIGCMLPRVTCHVCVILRVFVRCEICVEWEKCFQKIWVMFNSASKLGLRVWHLVIFNNCFRHWLDSSFACLHCMTMSFPGIVAIQSSMVLVYVTLKVVSSLGVSISKVANFPVQFAPLDWQDSQPSQLHKSNAHHSNITCIASIQCGNINVGPTLILHVRPSLPYNKKLEYNDVA